MSKCNDYFREWDKQNLIDDLIILFPKLLNSVIIRRSNGDFYNGYILKSNIFKNFYAEWDDGHHSWFLPIVFCDSIKGRMYKFMNINELIYSGFSYNEIILIKNTLINGIRRDIHNISPDFHSFNRDLRTFRNNLRNENTNNTNINPDEFLNIPPLTL